MLQANKEIEEIYLEKIKAILLQGKKRKSTKSRKSRKYIYGLSEDGSDDFVLTGKEVTYVDEDINHFDGIPEQILSMIHESLSVENAIKKLENLGYVVIDPSLVSNESENNQGLSDNTINLIKSRILGID